MSKQKLMLFIVMVCAIVSGSFLAIQNTKSKPNQKKKTSLSDIKGETVKNKEPAEKSNLAKKDLINILLLGVDRRSKQEKAYNTDTMVLLSANPEENVVLLTSVPRDLWINGNKLNALYSVGGEDLLIDAFEEVTGLDLDGYIRCDFEDFRWIVDSFGGVPVDIERSFTDVHFPNDTDTGLRPVNFEAGHEIMNGSRALDFARSRKGTNGEGSDLMRAKRQHLILMGMVDGISQPNSTFWPMDIPKFFEAVTQRMHTTLTITDVKYLWDFYKDRDEYEIISFVVDEKYVYHPGVYPNSSYHAWVFIPREKGFQTLHNDIKKMLFPSESVSAELESVE